MPKTKYQKPEVLALWYFRLNGVFTIPNFVLHPAGRGSARTDADIAGIRFPYRREFEQGVGGDDVWFEGQNSKPCAIIAEVKTSECAINGPWSDHFRGNVNKILSDLGLFSKDEVDVAAEGLYVRGSYEGKSLFCSLFCVGNAPSTQVIEKYPDVPQRTWREITHWMHSRFKRYQNQKADHDQWDNSGKILWKLYREAQQEEKFEQLLRQQFGLPSII